MTGSIIHFTDAAKVHITERLKAYDAGYGFRLSITKTGCNGFAYQPELVEKALEFDTIIGNEYEFCVFLEEKYLHLIKGTTVDYVSQGLGMKQLVFINPNAAGTCGCGESFNVKEGQ